MYMYVYVYDRCMVYTHALGLVMLPSDHCFWDYDDMFLYTCGIHTYIYILWFLYQIAITYFIFNTVESVHDYLQ